MTLHHPIATTYKDINEARIAIKRNPRENI
jgi:hypothetical protein